MRNQTLTFGPCRIAACEEEGPSLTHHLPTSSVVQFVCTLSNDWHWTFLDGCHKYKGKALVKVPATFVMRAEFEVQGGR